MSTVKWFNEIGKDEIGLVGGKGLSLARLSQAGIAVPPGFVITTEVYESTYGKGIDSTLTDTIIQAFDRLEVERVAVRSSAIAEDSVDASWAGQFESYLSVTRNELIESVQKCWSSASSEIVIGYAESQAIARDKLAIAVVVQKMIESEVSGVAFSVNPVNKDDSQIMIEATYGLGELLVQGMITPDNYLVDKLSFEILDKNIPHKTNMLTYSDSQNIEQPVSSERADEPCLDDDKIVELAHLVIEIEKYYGTPQDIEWALDKSEFYIVQSRPITTL